MLDAAGHPRISRTLVHPRTQHIQHVRACSHVHVTCAEISRHCSEIARISTADRPNDGATFVRGAMPR